MSAVVLLIASLALAWLARPRTGWSGEQAALFCSGLIGLCASAWQLLTLSAPFIASAEASYLLTSLSQYAAFPLLLLVTVIQGLKRSGYVNADTFNWDRIIWGRILLVLCVIYVLMQRSHNLLLLDDIILLLACSAAITWLITCMKGHAKPFYLVLSLLWLALTVSYFVRILPSEWLLPLGFVWSSTMIYRKHIETQITNTV
tara:strand:+ start:433 stop:1038 length:606 start_codon:yes stop_codon:yes gene_type:complete